MSSNLVRSAIERVDEPPSAEFLNAVRTQLLAELSRSEVVPGVPPTAQQFVALASNPSSVMPDRRFAKVLLAVAASVVLIVSGVLIVNRADDNADPTGLHDVDRQEALTLGKAAFIVPTALGPSWRAGSPEPDDVAIREVAAVVAADPSCEALHDFGLWLPTTKGVPARQAMVSSSGAVAHTVFVYATEQDAARAMDYINSDGFPDCHFALFDRLSAFLPGSATPTSVSWDAPQIPRHGDRQIIIGQLIHIKPGTNKYVINAFVQVGRAISWINPEYLPDADQPFFRADKAMDAAAAAVESAFGS